jgi:uncharacterized membrane protein
MSRLQSVLLTMSCVVGVAIISTSDMETFKIARVALALLLVFIVPGFALVSAALPGRQLSPGEYALSSVGASIAISVATAVALGAAPVGLTKLSFSIALGSCTLVFSIAAALRSRGHKGSRATSEDEPR